MKKRHLYFIPATSFLVFAGLHLNDPNALYFIGIYVFMSLANILAALGRLNYMVIISGFALLLFLITKDFPPIENWGLATKEGRDILGLIVSCNWLGFLGILKLYNDSYK